MEISLGASLYFLEGMYIMKLYVLIYCPAPGWQMLAISHVGKCYRVSKAWGGSFEMLPFTDVPAKAQRSERLC